MMVEKWKAQGGEKNEHERKGFIYYSSAKFELH